MSELSELIDRMTTTLASAVENDLRDINTRVRTLGESLERFAARLSDIFGSTTGTSSGTEAAAALNQNRGVVLVRVVNESSSPVPVLVTGEPRDTGGLAGVMGGIGGFLGGLVGGFFGGFGAPLLLVVALGELITALGIALPLVARISDAIGDLRRFMHAFFNELHRAGILPATRLVATALLLVETLIRIVLFYLQALLNWVVLLLEGLAAWLGQFIRALGSWLAGMLNALVPFLRDLTRFLLREMAGTLIGAGAIAALMMKEALAFGAELLAHRLMSALSSVIPGVTVPPAPGDISSRLQRAEREGQGFGRSAAARLVPDVETPRFRPRGFRPPELDLPEFEAPGSALESLFGTGAARGGSTGAAEGAARARPVSSPVTLNGGINVQIHTDRLDEANAEATGRTLARQIYDELARLVEVDRFRRGLPTAAIA